MKKLMKTLFAVMVMVSMIAPATLTNVSAATRKYEVVFRSGSQGTFKTEGLKGDYVINKDHTVIKYTVNANGTFPDVPELDIKEGYRNNSWSPALPQVGTKVQEKQVYVAKYTKLVNAVEFTVKYVDKNGVELATPSIYTTDLNTEEIVRAKTIDGYQPDSLQKRLVVSRENVEIQFVYTSTREAEKPPVIEQIVYVEGEPVYVDVFNTTTVGGGANGGQANNPTNQNPTTNNQNGNPTVEVEDPNTPQANGDDTTNVDDEKTPLSKGQQTSGNVLYVAGTLGVIVVIMAVVYLLKKKRNA